MKKKTVFGKWPTTLISAPSAVIGGYVGGLFTMYSWIIDENFLSNTCYSAIYGVCCASMFGFIFFVISIIDSSDVFEYKTKNVIFFFISIVVASISSSVVGSYIIISILQLTKKDLSATTFFLAPFILSIFISLFILKVLYFLLPNSFFERDTSEFQEV